MPTAESDQMKEVVGALAPGLKAAGFRKRRHSFNRETTGSLTHVVDFQMGSFLPPGAQEVPPIRFNMYGKFTVNLGVFVSTLNDRLGYRAPKGWVNEYMCQLRFRLGTLASGDDWWWKLDHAAPATEDVRTLLAEVGLPWLDRFHTRNDIIDAFFSDGSDALGMVPAGPLHIGLLLLDEGETAQAERVVSDHLKREHQRGHREYLERLLPKQGLGHLLTEPT